MYYRLISILCICCIQNTSSLLIHILYVCNIYYIILLVLYIYNIQNTLNIFINILIFYIFFIFVISFYFFYVFIVFMLLLTPFIQFYEFNILGVYVILNMQLDMQNVFVTFKVQKIMFLIYKIQVAYLITLDAYVIFTVLEICFKCLNVFNTQKTLKIHIQGVGHFLYKKCNFYI